MDKIKQLERSKADLTASISILSRPALFCLLGLSRERGCGIFPFHNFVSMKAMTLRLIG